MSDEQGTPEAAELQKTLTKATPTVEKEAPGTVTIDVGAVEDKKASHEPPEGSKRWNEVYGKMKDFERQLESAKGDKKQTDVLISEMRNHNQKLVTSIEEMTEATTKVADAKTKVSEVDKLEGTIKELKAKRVEATKALDYDAADDITDALGDARSKVKELKAGPAKATQTKPASSGTDPVTTAWINEHEWFKNDKVMRDAAVTYEDELSNQYPNESLGDILERVKVKVYEKFNIQGNGNGASRGTLVEGGNSNGSGPASKGTVRLSPTEVAVAEGLGISLEDYAKQKVMTGGR